MWNFLYKCYICNLRYIYNNHTQRWQGWGVIILRSHGIPQHRPSFHFLQVYSLGTSFIHVIQVFHNGINMVTMTKMTSLKQSNNNMLNIQPSPYRHARKSEQKDQFMRLVPTWWFKNPIYVWEMTIALTLLTNWLLHVITGYYILCCRCWQCCS